MDSARALRQTRLFAAMPEAELAKLAKLALTTRFRRDEEICREGAVGNELFVLVLGSVRAVKADASANEQEIAVFGSGACFGEMSMVAADHKRAATLRALEDCEVLSLSGDAINALADIDASFGCAFFRALARGLTQRMRNAGAEVAMLKSLARRN